MALMVGIAALIALVVGVGAVLVVGTRHAREEAGPTSRPDDFVAPVSSGGYRWRKSDESTDEFHARVARDGATPGADEPPKGA